MYPIHRSLFDNLEVLASYFLFNFHSQPINTLFFRALALPSSFMLKVQNSAKEL